MSKAKMSNDTITKHGVVVAHKGFKIGDEVYSKMANTKGVLSEIITDDKDCFRVLFSDEHIHWHEPKEIEHLADYELRTKREEFERKFKGKKIRRDKWCEGRYIVFKGWGNELNFTAVDENGEVLMSVFYAGFNWQILEEPHSLDDLKVGDVIENERHETLIIEKINNSFSFCRSHEIMLNDIEGLKSEGYKIKEQSE